MQQQNQDFVVAILNNNLKIPRGWTVSYHKFGNPTLKKKDLGVDIFPLSDYQYIKKNKLERMGLSP